MYAFSYLILLGEAKDPKGVLRSIDDYMAEVHASGEMDHVRWQKSLWAKSSGGNSEADGTMDECAGYLKWFIRERMKTMDAAYPAPNAE